MLPLALLYAGMGATSFVVSRKTQEKAAQNGMQTPGWAPVVGLGGIAALLLGGPVLGMLGAGAALGVIEGVTTTNTTRDAVAQAISAQMKAGIPGSAPAQIPAGAKPPLGQPGSMWSWPGRMLDNILRPSTPATP